MTDQPLSATALETRLDATLDPALSARRTTHLAEALAPFARGEQEFVLRWTDVIARTNTEMAYLFATQAPEGLRRMALDDIEAWIVQTMDVYDRMGLFPACKVFREVGAFATEARDYLPHLYGAVNWALVEDVKKLPLKVSDIYRRLTT